MFWLFLGRTIKKTGYILVIKLLADLLAGQVNGLENVDVLLKLYLSSILTLIIWILLILIMYTINFGEMKTIFIILFLTYMCQYLSIGIDILNVFVIASPGLVDNFPLWILVKLCTLTLLILVSYNLFRNKEFIGGVKDD